MLDKLFKEDVEQVARAEASLDLRKYILADTVPWQVVFDAAKKFRLHPNMEFDFAEGLDWDGSRVYESEYSGWYEVEFWIPLELKNEVRNSLLNIAPEWTKSHRMSWQTPPKSKIPFAFEVWTAPLGDTDSKTIVYFYWIPEEGEQVGEHCFVEGHDVESYTEKKRRYTIACRREVTE